MLKLGHGAFNEWDDTASAWGVPMALPAGSRVRMKINFYRPGKWGGGGSGCERRQYDYEPNDTQKVKNRRSSTEKIFNLLGFTPEIDPIVGLTNFIKNK